MRTLIAYAGKTGNTAKCARKLAIHLNQVTLVDLNAEVVNPKDFDAVIVASPVYSHKFERSVGSFLKKYQEILQTKPFAAFVTMVEYDSFTKEVNNLTPFNWHDKIIAKSMIKLESKKHPIEFLPEAEKQFVAQLNKVEWI